PQTARAARTVDRTAMQADASAFPLAAQCHPNGRHRGGPHGCPPPAGAPGRRCRFRSRRAPAERSRNRKRRSCRLPVVSGSTSLPEAFSFGVVALVATPSNQDHAAEPTVGEGPRKTGQAAVLSFFLFPVIGSPKPPAVAARHSGDLGRIEQLRQVLHLPPAPGPCMMPQPVQVNQVHPPAPL